MPSRDRRRLAAILAADVVGYSRLMQADEAGTLDRLKELRDRILHPGIAEYGGRIVKTTGDGFLVEFPSAVDALQCAAELQRAMAASAVAEPVDRRLRLRIGVNLGDIIIEDQDIYGDGVNIAARLEALAQPGGICVSDTVRDHTSGKVEVELVDGGECELKNIERPVRVWHWLPAEVDTEKPPDRRFGRWRPTIAVLPFDNISGDPEQDYFADGLTEDLITALTHWRSFPVVARNSTFTYKGKSISIPQVARELGANYIVEGSVRKAGRRVRVTAQLIDGATGHHVWAERYDRDFEDVFELQDDLTNRIAALVAPEVSRAELRRSAAKRTNDLDAWDHCLRGEALLAKYAAVDAEKARAHFKQAIALDPEYSDAYTGLARSYVWQVRFDPTANMELGLKQAIDVVSRAIELDPESSRARFVLSTAYILRDEHDPALAEAHLAVDLNPNDPVVLHALGNKSDLAGDPEGIGRMEVAQQLNPRDPGIHVHRTFLARAYVNARDYDAAIAKARAAIHRRPDYAPAHYILAIALAHSGRTVEAAAALQHCESLSPGFGAGRADWRPYTDQTSNEHLNDGLRKAMAAAGED